MRFAIFLMFSAISAGSLFAQDEMIIETQPEYPGGISAFHRYVTSGLELSYKQMKKLKGDKLFIQFVVGGDVFIDTKSVSSVKGMTTIEDSEIILKAVKLVSESIQWKAGTSNGQPVEMRLVLPINF